MQIASEKGWCQELVGTFLTSKNYLILIHKQISWKWLIKSCVLMDMKEIIRRI
jgi:hypothetical protein